MFGASYDSTHNFINDDKWSPASRNKTDVNNKVKAILNKYGTKVTPNKNRSTDKISKGYDLIARRL